MISRRLPFAAFTICTLALPRAGTAGQEGVPGPAVEIGADVSIAGPDGGTDNPRTAFGPRITFNLSPRNAVTVFGDVATTRQEFGGSWEESRAVIIELRRALHESGPLSVNALVGTGVGWRHLFVPAFLLPGRDGPTTVPAEHRIVGGPAATLGLGFDVRLGPRLSLQQDTRFVFARGVAELRAQAGLSVPVGSYPSGPVRRLDVGSASLRTGQAAWITGADGIERQGAVRITDDNHVEIVTGNGRVSYARDEIQRVRVRDSVLNGARRGAILGASGLTGFIVYLAAVLCGGEDCEGMPQALVLGAGYGAAFGAVGGALLDSLFERPVTIFDRSNAGSTVTLRPVVEARRAGVRAVLEW